MASSSMRSSDLLRSHSPSAWLRTCTIASRDGVSADLAQPPTANDLRLRGITDGSIAAGPLHVSPMAADLGDLMRKGGKKAVEKWAEKPGVKGDKEGEGKGKDSVEEGMERRDSILQGGAGSLVEGGTKGVRKAKGEKKGKKAKIYLRIPAKIWNEVVAEEGRG